MAALVAACEEVGPGGPFVPTPLVIDTTGLPPFPVVENNPLTVEGVALGRRLFHDPILSGNRTQSCSSCHSQAHAFSDNGRQFSVGIDSLEGTRNAPALFNLAWSSTFFLDGRVSSLEDQAREPVSNPIEMHLSWGNALLRLSSHGRYPDLFDRAFGDDEITQDRVVMALAQFERTLISKDSRYDKSVLEEVELTPAEQRGQTIFFTKGECFRCHGSILFTDDDFHDIGLDLTYEDPGRQVVTGFSFDLGEFRTPSLRNIELTAPYMHDGRFATLAEVVEHYSTGIVNSPNLAHILRTRPGGLALTPVEASDLIAFLETLTDLEFLENPDYTNPF